MKRYRTALAVLLLTASATAQERGLACSDPVPGEGKTVQQTTDQMFDERVADPLNPAYVKMFLGAAKNYFDSLCVVDQLMDTREASHFIAGELTDSLHRISAAGKTRKEAGGN